MRMVDTQDQSKWCNISTLKKLFIFLLIIPTLGLSYVLFQTHIQVAVFDIASNRRNTQPPISHQYDLLTSNYRLDRPAVYREGVTITNTAMKGTSDGSREENTIKTLEESTVNSLGETTARETTIVHINKPLSSGVNGTPKYHHTESGPTAVILLTYMRSGSSLTGDILQQPEDAFYIFEPLKNAQFIALGEKPIHFINGTSLEFGQYDLQRIYEETLYGWLTCDLSRVYGESLLDVGFMAFGHKFRSYNICINRFPLEFWRLLNQNTLHKNANFIKCLNMLQNICLKSKFRIVKTIRANMEVAQLLLNGIPNSKILHLIRDPRATIESQRHRGRCKEGLTLCIAEHCDRVRKDTAAKQSIIADAPKRISHVLYEDIASRPIVTAQKMYSFIGMEFTDTIANYVYNITKGKDKSGCSVCLLKWQVGTSDSSSETHIEAWKEKLPGKYINQTQIICKDVIKNYGYEAYKAPPDYKGKKDMHRFQTLVKTLRYVKSGTVKNTDVSR